MSARKITPDDILPLAEYVKIRPQRKSELREIKKYRRVQIGPDCSAYFECFETMRHQIQEMLYIEKGGDEQLIEELAAYNPLIPDGSELVCTVMFEIDDPTRRARLLARLGGIEKTMFLEIDGTYIRGEPEQDLDRTSADGKASSVQFIHFPFTDRQAQQFKQADCKSVLGFEHAQYGHMVSLSPEIRQALAQDLA